MIYENNTPVEINEAELNKVSGGAGGEGKMVCRLCGATTTDPQTMKKWILGTYNRDGEVVGVCEKCKSGVLRVERPAHAE